MEWRRCVEWSSVDEKAEAQEPCDVEFPNQGPVDGPAKVREPHGVAKGVREHGSDDGSRLEQEIAGHEAKHGCVGHCKRGLGWWKHKGVPLLAHLAQPP